MVMPPFPPPPYMEAPAYILPHPHMQPVDYRRVLHPQVHTAAAPYQSRRTRPPVRETVNSEVQTEPTPSRSVNGYGERSPPVSSESGQGTATTSPSSSSSSSQKQGCAEVDDYDLPRRNAEGVQVNRKCPSGTEKHAVDNPPTAPKPLLASIGATLEMKKKRKDGDGQGTCRTGHCDMCSMCSTDSLVPVCSSSDREDDVTKERRVSFPDTVMSWGGGGTPQVATLKTADKVLPPNEDQLLPYDVCHGPTGTKTSQIVTDDAESVFIPEETLHKILKLPFDLRQLLSESRRDEESPGTFGSFRRCRPSKDAAAQQELSHSLNKSHDVADDPEQESYAEEMSLEETAELIYQTSFSASQTEREMNVSLWSVESLAAYLPSNEWLMQNGLGQQSDLTGVTEDAENRFLSTPNSLNVRALSEGRLSRRFPLSSNVCLSSASCFDRCQKCDNQLPVACLQNATVASQAEDLSPHVEAQRGLGTDHSETHSPTLLQSKKSLHTPPEEDMNGSSEPEANQSPNQESHAVGEQQEKTLCSPEPVQTPPLNQEEEEKRSSEDQAALRNEAEAEQEVASCRNEEVGELREESLCPPVVDQRSAALSPSKVLFVDCGVQCTELQEWKCSCDELKNNMGPNRKYLFRLSGDDTFKERFYSI